MAPKKQVEQPEGAETTSPESDEEDQAAPAKVAKKAKSSEPITVKFRDHTGATAERTFSKDVHGEDFAKLADEFKATNASKLITE